MDKSEYNKLVEEANSLVDKPEERARLIEICKKITQMLWGNCKKTQEESFKEFDKYPPFS